MVFLELFLECSFVPFLMKKQEEDGETKESQKSANLLQTKDHRIRIPQIGFNVI